VLVGYDGSLPAQHALQSFALLGLAEGDAIEVAAASGDQAEAGRLAAEAATYLRNQGAAVTEWPVVGGDPAELLLAEAARLPARLLVMGGFGKGGLRALLLGTATRRLLREAPCAVLVQH
jgi:nucleotide-binding universal stress UspA family protein